MRDGSQKPLESPVRRRGNPGGLPRPNPALQYTVEFASKHREVLAVGLSFRIGSLAPAVARESNHAVRMLSVPRPRWDVCRACALPAHRIPLVRSRNTARWGARKTLPLRGHESNNHAN